MTQAAIAIDSLVPALPAITYRLLAAAGHAA